MRINVYAEELTPEVVIVTKTSDADADVKFYGIRIFLESSKKLPHNVDADDRSAITFWVKWTQKKGTDISMLQKLVMNILGKLSLIEERGEQESGGGAESHG